MTTKDLVDPSFCKSLLGTLEEKQINGSNIVLEVSENTSPDLLLAAKRTLSLLRNYNIKIALDDFGTEYSTMLFLNELPVDIVKIDKSFVQETPSSRRARSLLKFGVNISHDLGCEVVAEGIETQEQLDCVKDSGADIGQGFLFSAPFINFKKKMTPFIELCEFASFPIESLQKAYCWRCS
jgi:EAL domain-containing protein (putative c-di-GMP-specific phosphodiesterase class I)